MTYFVYYESRTKVLYVSFYCIALYLTRTRSSHFMPIHSVKSLLRTYSGHQNRKWHLNDESYLVASKNAERLHDLVRGVSVGRLTRHEVEERVKRDVAHVVWVDRRHDSLEIYITLQHTHTTDRLFTQADHSPAPIKFPNFSSLFELCPRSCIHERITTRVLTFCCIRRQVKLLFPMLILCQSHYT